MSPVASQCCHLSNERIPGYPRSKFNMHVKTPTLFDFTTLMFSFIWILFKMGAATIRFIKIWHIAKIGGKALKVFSFLLQWIPPIAVAMCNSLGNSGWICDFWITPFSWYDTAAYFTLKWWLSFESSVFTQIILNLMTSSRERTHSYTYHSIDHFQHSEETE